MNLLCPVCSEPLAWGEHSCRCAAGHSFDIARQGYVNLLTVDRKHSLNPGDTREQVAARRQFLDGGFYAPIADALLEEASLRSITGPILDVGCGEGYYSSHVARGLGADLTGLDISKEAVRCAAGRYKDARWLCATAAKLPVADHSAGLVMSLFALTVPEEFHRVLMPEGYYFQVLAAEDHLMGLKRIIYPELKHKSKDSVPEIPGFVLEKSRPIRFFFTAEGAQVQNLLYMTPHVYRIGAEGAEKLRQTEVLSDEASCILNIYRPV